MDEKNFEGLKQKVFYDCKRCVGCYGDLSKPFSDENISRHTFGFRMYCDLDSFVRKLRIYALISEEQFCELIERIDGVRHLYLGC